MSIPSSFRTSLILAAFATAVVVAVVFIRARSETRLSIEDKVNISALANKLCKAAAASDCPIEWRDRTASLPARSGQALASLEQVRTVLAKPQWTESAPQGGWAFGNGKYTVTLTPASGAIVIEPS